jgi:CheY-like chemotaxis protein
VAAILIVDDSPSLIAAASAALTDVGYQVRGAEDWKQVREVLKQGPLDAVVLDVQMPGMVSGDLLAMQLRKDPRCASARLLLHSGLAPRDLSALATRCRADGWLQKSDPAALVKALLAMVQLDEEAQRKVCRHRGRRIRREEQLRLACCGQFTECQGCLARLPAS